MPDLPIIDVSHWQGKVDWAVVAQRTAGVYIKSSESGYIDPEFAVNRSGAESESVLWGAYHFFRPAYSPVHQAKLFARCITGSKLWPFLDVESAPPVFTERPWRFKLAFEQFVRSFFDLTGIYVGVYTRYTFWDALMPKTDMEKHKLWVAYYDKSAVEPVLPRDWGDWVMWQWSADGNNQGHNYGVSSRDVDLNWYKYVPLLKE
jgi:lysozyme